jgi:hypothetical protein
LGFINGCPQQVSLVLLHLFPNLHPAVCVLVTAAQIKPMGYKTGVWDLPPGHPKYKP